MQASKASPAAVRSPGEQGDSAIRRSPELEDALNRYLYHPLSSRLARLLQPTAVSPNAVSVAGMLLVWAAAWAYVTIAWPYGALLGFALHLGWHVVDGADGDLARLTGRASPTGEMVDGLCDYAAHVVLYVALASMLDDRIGGWAWVLATAAGASHAFQTNHAESHRRNYLWWACGIPWLKHTQAAGDEALLGRNAFGHLCAWLTSLYLRAARWMAPWSTQLDALVDDAASDPARQARIRRLVRRASRRSLLYEKLIGPNPRTIMLGISMLAGSPLWYFLAETLLLNLILVASIVHHNTVQRLLANAIGRGLLEDRA